MHSQSELLVYEARTFLQRFRGLIGLKMLDENEALLIDTCSMVHSFGMKYSLDIVYLNKAGKVLKVNVLKPNGWTKYKGAEFVVELKAGCAELHGLVEGEFLTTFEKLTIDDRDAH